MRSRTISPTSRWPGGRVRLGAAAALLAGTAVSLMAGCQETLFPANTPRTQFEAYDRMRNQAAPEKEFDALGRQQPALRARLAPK